MFKKTRETLALFLLTALPLHALLVTIGTKFLVGPNEAPLTLLTFWKEALLAIIFLLAFLEWLKKRDLKKCWPPDLIDYLILGLIALSVIVTAVTHGNWQWYLFGFKYDFIPLVIFLILRRAEWSKQFWSTAKKVILIVGGAVAAYGIATFFLPVAFFSWLGYNDLHSVYVPGEPLAPFQMIGGESLRRIQSTMSGPNQLGLWLLLPWAIGVIAFLKKIRNCNTEPVEVRQFHALSSFDRLRMTMPLLYLLLISTALLLTFSRSAWVGAFVILVIALYLTQIKSLFKKMVIGMIALAVIGLIALATIAPNALLKATSTRDHLIKPVEAIQTIIKHPFGKGLATAGPASNRISDACLYFDEGDDVSWAQPHQNLCIFTGKTQVQPADRVCNCPLLPENWYLQIGVEMGILGLVLYLVLIIFILIKLGRQQNNPEVYLAFIGISIAALFLHAWEDSAVAYSVWLLIAIVLSAEKNCHPEPVEG